MPKRLRTTSDPSLGAKLVFKKLGEPAKNPAAVALGKLGGKKGGPARAAKLTPQERRNIAIQAALARWKKSPPHHHH
jgi:hypothetical protein